ncbi:pilus assembly protein [Nitrincola alkalisediminis]|uniref:pilus assembly protein n=1 Tax=Nitrincola alkalisediminis TaxID=1366656 RepID=UPI0018747936|nr:PilC/PilY family type IV pilus protein [Nitrincola alkalisediminis]
MDTRQMLRQFSRKGLAIQNRVSLLFTSTLFFAYAGSVFATPLELPTKPLTVVSNLPSNLVLTPSVEWPTILSVANLGGFSLNQRYSGYFDSDKCYGYQTSANKSEEHFFPLMFTTGYSCEGAMWSGNYLNWAATQTIDPFRKALTGGLRVKDTPTVTWLEKARYDRNNQYFGNRSLQNNVNQVTPFSNALVSEVAHGLGNRMRVVRSESVDFEIPTALIGTNVPVNRLGDGFWQTDNPNGLVEINKASAFGVAGGDDLVIELERNTNDASNLYRDLSARSGETYQLKFSYAPRSGHVNSSNINVYWDGALIRSLSGSNTSWQVIELTLNANRTGQHRLEFRAANKDSVGGVLNNIHLSSAPIDFYVRVAVCVQGLLESNCVQYKEGWKPEGLIQEYASRMRYSVFAFLNDHDALRDGGVMRARQKYVGPVRLNPVSGQMEENPNREWDPVTGVLVTNPDPNDASATNTYYAIKDSNFHITNSGVINYLNKFGQLTEKQHKSHDPVSELYYHALRYMKNQLPILAYSSVPEGQLTDKQRWELADAFPVITDWDDPYQYWCQAGAILGIGDVNTHRDKNLPGNTRMEGEPSSVPQRVASDTSYGDKGVVSWTDKVAKLEGITINTPFTGRENSAYMVGMAYHARTSDLRPNLQGKQTLSTHWVDVREGQALAGKNSNQYWLAAKYGGLQIPDDFDPETFTGPIPDHWWHDSGDVLTQTGDKRPRNFYVASEADKMVQSLEDAFKNISSERFASGGGVVATSSELNSNTLTFTTEYNSNHWSGDLVAYKPLVAGGNERVWRANEQLPTWEAIGGRKIYTHSGTYGVNHKPTLVPFVFEFLTAEQKSALGDETLVNYLRGDRSLEQSQPNGVYRTRQSVLGTFINSLPIYIGSPENVARYEGYTFKGANSYLTWARSQKSRAARVYAGSNSGMLHSFDANTGVETFAFVPNAVIKGQMVELANPDYEHAYLVDGELAAADVFINNQWRSVLVGSLGLGGKGIFALDVTNPNNISLLWEISADSAPELGVILGKPVIAQVADGDWRVIFGNGLNSQSGKAQLLLVSIDTGKMEWIDTGVGGGNGLSAASVWDSSKQGFIDLVFAGDQKGNLWKFSSLLSPNPVVTKLFETGGQPISSAPLLGQNPYTSDLQRWIFFGTGRYLVAEDVTDKSLQTWYGLKDSNTLIKKDQLVERQILAEVVAAGRDLRVISEGTTNEMAGKSGWFIPLISPTFGQEGERMVLSNVFRGRVLLGTTRIPDFSDRCMPGGRGYQMVIDPFTGGRLSYSFFDVNSDGVFNESDYVTFDDEKVPVSGLGTSSPTGNPVFIEDKMITCDEEGNCDSSETQLQPDIIFRTSWREVLF